MKNGEITKVAYEGAEYERVEGDAKAGDLGLINLGKIIGADGSFYEVIGGDCEGDAVIEANDGVEIAVDRACCQLFRKKHVRLKVGDYAKVVDASDHRGLAEGDFVRITEDDESDIPFYCDVLSGELAKKSIWMHESKLVLATQTEVTASKEAETKWAKIGRKVDEYKVGDIVAYDDRTWFRNSGLGEVVVNSTDDSSPEIRAINSVGDSVERFLSPEKLTLITPVEARFDRS